MVKKILKFGGTSVGTIERVQHVAKIIKKEHSMGNKVVAVVSAMAGKTNELIKLSKEVSEEFSKREYDVLLSSGEQVTCALLAGALIQLKVKAKSFLNWQVPILTDGEHSNARIINMHVEKINEYLEEKGVKLDTSKIPVDAEKILVSKGEVIIPDVIAAVIGYDKLEEINGVGTDETRQILAEQSKEKSNS